MVEIITIDILNNEIELDRLCYSCMESWGYKKTTPDFREDDGSCSECNGTGYQLTDVGASLLNFFDRHISNNKKYIRIDN